MAPAGKQVELHDLQGKAVEHIGGLNSEWSATTAYKACQSVGLNAFVDCMSVVQSCFVSLSACL